MRYARLASAVSYTADVSAFLSTSQCTQPLVYYMRRWSANRPQRKRLFLLRRSLKNRTAFTCLVSSRNTSLIGCFLFIVMFYSIAWAREFSGSFTSAPPISTEHLVLQLERLAYPEVTEEVKTSYCIFFAQKFCPSSAPTH